MMPMTNTTCKAQKTSTTFKINICHILRNFTPILILLFVTTLNVTAADHDKDPIITLLKFDAIPAITKPQFVPAAKAKLDADAPVIGVPFNGESHAYSLYLLNGHEIVNDVVGGKKIATTW